MLVSCGKEMMKIFIFNLYFLFYMYLDGGAMDKIKISKDECRLWDMLDREFDREFKVDFDGKLVVFNIIELICI